MRAPLRIGLAVASLLCAGLAGAGIHAAIDRPGDPTPTPPKAFEDVRVEQARCASTDQRSSEECSTVADVQRLLITAGANGANVHVGDGGGDPRISAQVFLPKSLERRWDAPTVARAIATTVGTPVRSVTITDDELRPLYPAPRAN